MRRHGRLAILGGLLLLLGGSAGSFLPRFLYDVLEPRLGPGWPRDLLLVILGVMIILAMLGGLTVMVGGLAITKGWKRTGKVLISLGCALGLLGLILYIIISLATDTLDSFKVWICSITGIGSLLSIAAHHLA